MIALVESNTRGPPEKQDLFFGLVLFSTSEKASSRNANIEEWPIIGATVKCRCSKVLAYTRKVVLEEGLDFSTASRPAQIECAAVSVIYGVDKVG